jgi:flagellar biogenesis protein FliO
MIGLLSAGLLLLSAPDSTRADSLASVPARPDSVAEARLRTAQAAWDKSAPATQDGAPISGAGLMGSLAQLLAGLGFLALVGAGGLLVVRRARGRNPSRPGGSQMDLLETLPAGPGARVALVRVHDRVVAVAFSGSGVAPLAEFSGPQAAEILADSGGGRTAVKDFASSLESLMERFRKHPSGGGA